MEFDISLGAAFVAGLLSFLSPCVLPLVPPYLCYVAGISMEQLTAQNKHSSLTNYIVWRSVIFVFGFATVFVALGASASFIGGFVNTYLRELAIVAGVIIILMGLHFLGVLRIGLLYREARIQTQSKPKGWFGTYLMGLAFAFGWTPCAGPILAAILFLAGSENSVFQGAFLLLVYALGIGLPFILVAAFASFFVSALHKFKRHLGMVEKAMGLFLILTGVLFITGAMQSMAYYMLELFPSLGKFG